MCLSTIDGFLICQELVFFFIQGTFRDQRSHFEQHDQGQAVEMLNASSGDDLLNILYRCLIPWI